ncbi:MAG TPA: glycosyltransferase family 4 protein [Gemmataceae bacterium]|nr:glycosyltransferase family 4 protein [Gemmataceae bacterium]
MTSLATCPIVHPATAARRGRLRRVLFAAHLDPSRKFGSLEEQAYLLASAFRDRGGLFFPVLSAAPDAVGLAHYRDADLDFAALDLSRFRLAALVQLFGLIRKHRIEIVDWNFLQPLTNAYLWALSLIAPRVEHVFTDHNSRNAAAPRRRFDVIKRVFLRRYSSVIGVSAFVAECLRSQSIWPAVHTRLHFANTDRFAPNSDVRMEVRRRLGAGDRFVLLAVAHLIHAKGIDVAVRALARLPHSAEMWIVGDGDQSAALERLAQELGVRERVRLLGMQSRVEPYMQAADVFACPSRWEEAAGLVNIEAQACGLPVLASRVGGVPEYVIDGRTGILFPAGDDEALAAAAQRLMVDADRRRRMSQAARRLAVEQFSVAARLDDYLDLYRVSTRESER